MNKMQIYDSLKGKTLPPFIWRDEGRFMISFSKFDRENPLFEFADGIATIEKTTDLQVNNPSLCSELVHVHLRRIVWNRGVYRDGKAGILYFHMVDKSKDARSVQDRRGKQRWVVKRLVQQEDSEYKRKGETNFFIHRALVLTTPVYWSNSYVELTPRKYYTFDGITPIEGEIRKRIDVAFRNPLFDRSRTRIGLMKLWKFLLFESGEYAIKPEPWFDSFKFGNFLKANVEWSPEVIARNQTPLWDFCGGTE
jgi:hypothetical protein